MLELGLEPLVGTTSYNTERTKAPASPNTTRLDKSEILGTVRIVGLIPMRLRESGPNVITCGVSRCPA